MRFVDKQSFPALMREAQELLDASNGYNDNDRVREIIRIIYSGCCAYCGSTPEAVSYYQIEHFYPKNTTYSYSQYEKDIFNLHYSCQRCNNLKDDVPRLTIFSPNYYLFGSKWVHSRPDKIDSELKYIGYLFYEDQLGKNKRAEETIKIFDLNNQNRSGRSNRYYLIESRIKVYDQVYHMVSTLFNFLNSDGQSNSDAIRLLFMQLIKYTSPVSPYSGMIIQNFGESIIKLMTIYKFKMSVIIAEDKLREIVKSS